ncbi:hypothetical protein [Curtobacterium sp. MCJR17_043]|uniref:hypothetical protein n=1 Tax=Curtobacterium sp. MCJR17_043 TaxID=2175660 RepID=UPI0024DFCC14|nr:hypothetical protein [Curtobacterium sp. MCJR17_043]WIB36431.1 hypothetical protein DEJ15_04615 [Curtobacterium sp. MCJR17_043]
MTTSRLTASEVVAHFSGAEGTEVTATANGVTKQATIGDGGVASVVLPAPEALTTTVHVTSTNGDRTAEQDVVVGNGDHPSDQLAATVVNASALTGSAEIDVWGLPLGHRRPAGEGRGRHGPRLQRHPRGRHRTPHRDRADGGRARHHRRLG